MGSKGQRGDPGKSPPNITDVVLVRKQTVMHYQEETEAPFLKIVMALPMLVAACRGQCKDPVNRIRSLDLDLELNVEGGGRGVVFL